MVRCVSCWRFYWIGGDWVCLFVGIMIGLMNIFGFVKSMYCKMIIIGVGYVILFDFVMLLYVFF